MAGSKVWTVYSLGAGLAAAAVTRKALGSTWKMATGKTPPANPAHPDVRLNEAIAWAAFSGVAIQVARMLANRRAAHYYARSTGHLPPGMDRDDV